MRRMSKAKPYWADESYPSETRSLQIGWMADLGIGDFGVRPWSSLEQETASMIALFKPRGMPAYIQGDDSDFPFTRYEQPTRDVLPGGNMEALQTEASRLGLSLPEEYVRGLPTGAIRDRFCSFDFVESRVILPIPDGQGFLIHIAEDAEFLGDYYLYLNTKGEHAVLVYFIHQGAEEDMYGDEHLCGGDDGEAEEEEQEEEEDKNEEGGKKILTPEEKARTIWNQAIRCSPSYEDFTRRMYIETAIALRSKMGQDLCRTRAERIYLATLYALNSAPRWMVLKMIGAKMFRTNSASPLVVLPIDLYRRLLKALEVPNDFMLGIDELT